MFFKAHHTGCCSAAEETLTYCDFPYERHTRIRTNHVIERLNREIRRSTRVLCTFPDGDSALFPAAPRNRHTVGQHEYEAFKCGAGRRFYCRLTSFSRRLQTNLRITLDGTGHFHGGLQDSERSKLPQNILCILSHLLLKTTIKTTG